MEWSQSSTFILQGAKKQTINPLISASNWSFILKNEKIREALVSLVLACNIGYGTNITLHRYGTSHTHLKTFQCAYLACCLFKNRISWFQIPSVDLV